MKNKLFALLIFIITVFGLFIYLVYKFPNNTEKNISENSSTGTENITLKEIKTQTGNIKENKDTKINLEKETENINKDFSHYKTIIIDDKVFYFDIIGEKLNLSLNGEKNLGIFEITLKNDINLQKIYSSEDKFLLSLGNEKIILSKNNGILENFTFKIPIKYIKQSEKNYIIVSKVGSFLINKNSKEISYVQIFSDFIIYKNSYLGIIKKTDFERKNKFSINSKNKDIIFFYNPKTKEQKIIYETLLNIEKIFSNSGKLYLESDLGKVFELKNF